MYANTISITRKIVKLLIVFWAMSGLHAQDPTSGGFRHQGVVRDASGRPIPNMQATLQIVISEDARMGKALYLETHEVKTGASGEFSITVGEGNPVKGGMESISWAQEGLWMHVALQSKGSKRSSQVLSSSRLPVVPYAMHAISASRITGIPENEDKEKQQSVNWLTTGNSLTKPATHFLGTRDTAKLVFKTNNQTRMTISKEGQVHYNAGSTMTGTGKFPVHVKGASQGIHIKVSGSRDSNTVFVNFGDDINSSWGKIAGQTFADWRANDFDEENFKYSKDAKSFKIAELALAVAGMALTVKGAIATGIGIVEGIALGLDMSAVIGELAFYLKYFDITVEEGGIYQGVTYSSGAADYAEYLELAPGQRKLEPGEVVGVKNGQVSLVTEGADHILAVSSLPIALGNLPKESAIARYEKIAFMGQVKVRVVGAVNIGDYILPSGNHDGLGIAVRPDKMRASDYANILGVAWSGSLPGSAYQFINVAIGINAFEMSRELVRLERQVKAIKAFLKGESPDFKVQEKDNPIVTKAVPANVPEKKVEDMQKMSVETHARILDENKALVEQLFRNARSGLPADVREHPWIHAFLENPVPALKEMYRDPNGYLENFAREVSKFSGR